MYTDPILKKYADLIKANIPVFKRVYFGDPIRIGKTELPALVLQKIDTKIQNLSNIEDQHNVRISMTVVVDIRETLNDEKTMVAGISQLYDIIEGRNDTDYTLKSTSVLGTLRHNVELDVGNNLRTDLNTMSSASYSMTMGKRQENAWALEGLVEITALFTQNR
jgi:hypothetical protein